MKFLRQNHDFEFIFIHSFSWESTFIRLPILLLIAKFSRDEMIIVYVYNVYTALCMLQTHLTCRGEETLMHYLRLRCNMYVCMYVNVTICKPSRSLVSLRVRAARRPYVFAGPPPWCAPWPSR